jgi:hypothetical protein
MPSFLGAGASDWTGTRVPCYFTATADSARLNAPDEASNGSTAPVYTIQPGTKNVVVTAKPQANTYWEKPVSFSVASDGSIDADPQSRGFVKFTRAIDPFGNKLTYATIRVSRFKEVTTNVVELLKHPPTTRIVWNREKQKSEEIRVKEDEQEFHTDLYEIWPPDDWQLHDVPEAHFLADVTNPVASGVLKLAKGLAIENKVDSVVLRLAGVEAPQLFAVTWPTNIVLKTDAPPKFLLFVRQTNSNYNGAGNFEGSDPELHPYPDNFDYADIGLFESLHYAAAPTWRLPSAKADPLLWPYSKGVPYQVAKAGVDVVTVYPCPRYYGDEFAKEYGVLNNTEETGRILKELQAYMFARGGIQDAPKEIGKTAIAAYSSGNYILRRWLNDPANVAGDFLSKTVQALYFLDPPPDKEKSFDLINDCVSFSLAWAGDPGRDKRVRFYQRIPWPSHNKLLGSSLPPEPFVRNATANTRTLSVIGDASWKRTVGKVIGSTPTYEWTWQEAHHLIAATMLTHALAQDFH